MQTLRDFVQHNKQFIVAHRGASGTLTENTLPAFQKAVDAGAKMIEVDIQLSKDSVPVAFHDNNLKKLNIQKKTSELTKDELKTIELSKLSKNDSHTYNIPTLEEVLEFAIEHEIYLIIEIKTEFNEYDISKAEKIISLVDEYKFSPYVLYASFSKDVVKHINDIDQNYNTASILIPGTEIELPSELHKQTACEVYICSIDQINKQIVEDAEKSGIFLGVYSADNEEQLQKILDHGIKAIVTNYPERIAKLLESV